MHAMWPGGISFTHRAFKKAQSAKVTKKGAYARMSLVNASTRSATLSPPSSSAENSAAPSPPRDVPNALQSGKVVLDIPSTLHHVVDTSGRIEYDQRRSLYCVLLGERRGRAVIRFSWGTLPRVGMMLTARVPILLLIILGMVGLVGEAVFLFAVVFNLVWIVNASACMFDTRLVGAYVRSNPTLWLNLFLVSLGTASLCVMLGGDYRGIGFIFGAVLEVCTTGLFDALPVVFTPVLLYALPTVIAYTFVTIAIVDLRLVPGLERVDLFVVPLGATTLPADALSTFNAAMWAFFSLSVNDFLHRWLERGSAQRRTAFARFEGVDVNVIIDADYMEYWTRTHR